jgi:phosphinothricin acetyltransferase
VLARIAIVTYTIDKLQESDWERVRSIYLEGIATGNATFETDAPDWEAWNRNHSSFARLVARDEHSIPGWAALSPVSSRSVYVGVAEVSVYVASSARGKGIGRVLLTGLVDEAERNGVWMLQAGIFPENFASVALHKSCVFREIGRREKLGRLNGVWRDVVLLERRSRTVGVE